MFILIDSLLHHIQCRCGLSGDVLHLIIHFKISINSIFTSHMTRKKNSVDMKFDTILCVKGLIMFNVAQQVLRALEWNRGRCNKFRGLIAGQTVISGPQTLNGLVEWWFYWNWIYVSVEPFSLSHGKCLSVRMRCANGRHRAITKNKNFNCRLISIKKLSNKFNLAVQLLEFCEFLLLHGPHWNDNLVFFLLVLPFCIIASWMKHKFLFHLLSGGIQKGKNRIPHSRRHHHTTTILPWNWINIYLITRITIKIGDDSECKQGTWFNLNARGWKITKPAKKCKNHFHRYMQWMLISQILMAHDSSPKCVMALKWVIETIIDKVWTTRTMLGEYVILRDLIEKKFVAVAERETKIIDRLESQF